MSQNMFWVKRWNFFFFLDVVRFYRLWNLTWQCSPCNLYNLQIQDSIIENIVLLQVKSIKYLLQSSSVIGSAIQKAETVSAKSLVSIIVYGMGNGGVGWREKGKVSLKLIFVSHPEVIACVQIWQTFNLAACFKIKFVPESGPLINNVHRRLIITAINCPWLNRNKKKQIFDFGQLIP